MEITLKAILVLNNGVPSVSFRNKKEYLDFLKEIPVGEELVIDIAVKRSLSQNRLFHKIISLIASHIGESFEATKHWIVCKFFGCIETEIDGQAISTPVSTSKLNKEKFAEGLTNTIIFAEELGIKVPQHEILTKLKQ